jgi:hypothetical protein
MANGSNETALVKVVQPVEAAADACWEVVEASALSPTSTKVVRVPIPSSLDRLTPLQEAYLLSTQKAWAGQSLPYLVNVSLQARARGLDIWKGELYQVDGKLATDDAAKINHARRAGKIEFVKIGEFTKGAHPVTGAVEVKLVPSGTLPNGYIEVTMKHKDESEPQFYRAWLSEWYNPKNANWAARPLDALERKALARISNRMFPLGEDSEDFSPVIELPGAQQAVVLETQLRASLQKAAGETSELEKEAA